MPSQPPLRALVFDAYGTLFDVYSVAATAERLFPQQGAALSALWRTKQLEYSWMRSMADRYLDFWAITDDALRYCCAALNLPADEAAIAQMMDSYLYLTPYPDVRGALEALSATYPLAILSNGAPQMLQSVVTNNDLKAFFAHVLSVDEIGIYKPDALVYDLAASRLDLAPAEIGFVSSNGWDAFGATSYGFRVHWINRTGAPLDRLGTQPPRSSARSATSCRFCAGTMARNGHMAIAPERRRAGRI